MFLAYFRIIASFGIKNSGKAMLSHSSVGRKSNLFFFPDDCSTDYPEPYLTLSTSSEAYTFGKHCKDQSRTLLLYRLCILHPDKK